MDFCKFVLTTAILFVGAPAMAATIASGNVSYSLALVGSVPDDTSVEFLDPISGGSQTSTGLGSADFSASLEDVTSIVSASAAAPFLGFGSSDAFYETSYFFESASFDPIELFFELTYSLSALAQTDRPFDGDAMASSLIELVVGGTTVLSQTLSFDIDSLGEDTFSTVLPFTVVVDGFQDLTIFAETTAFASSVAAVPVPAAGLMLLGALGGLAALRRERRRA